MIRQITIPSELELKMDETLKGLDLAFEKKTLAKSAIYPLKTTNGYLMYELNVNETIAFYIGLTVQSKINE